MKPNCSITGGALQERFKKKKKEKRRKKPQAQAHLNSNVVLAVSDQADTQQVQLIEMLLIMH